MAAVTRPKIRLPNLFNRVLSLVKDHFGTVDVHFVASQGSLTDPRHGYSVVGVEGFFKPVGLLFSTPIVSIDTRTTITRLNGGEEVAAFRWAGASGTVVGSATTFFRSGKRDMLDYVMMPPGCPPNCRYFDSVGPDRRPQTFSWVKSAPDTYDLFRYNESNVAVQIGHFEPQSITTPHLDYQTFARFTFSFPKEDLLVDALMALALNRWMNLGR